LATAAQAAQAAQAAWWLRVPVRAGLELHVGEGFTPPSTPHECELLLHEIEQVLKALKDLSPLDLKSNLNPNLKANLRRRKS
jgi:hypothetical protein